MSAGETATEVGQMRMDLMRSMFDEQRRQEMRKRAFQPTEGKPQGGLKPWREVVTPHPDVASGRYQQAEFAADLWQVFQGEGSDSLTTRASKKLKNEESLMVQMGGVRLRTELDRIPLWTGNHVSIKQLCEYMARYLYLPRLRDENVLIAAIQDGVSSLAWNPDTFAYAEAWDEQRERYQGLKTGTAARIVVDERSLLVLPEVAAGGGDADAAGRRLEVLEGIPLLEPHHDMDALVHLITLDLSLPDRAAADAVHIAFAAVHAIDDLLTWNCTHIANAAFRHGIGVACNSLGHRVSIICELN